MKKCNICKFEKPLEAYTKDKYQLDGLDRKCKICKAKKYAEIDKTKRSAWRRNYYRAHLEQELNLCEIYREANKDERNAYIAEYYKLYPYKGAAKTAKYRAARLKATPPWLTKEQLKEIEMIYKNCPSGYEVDHIIPLQGKQVKGLHVPWNLQLLPSSTNKRKSNRIGYHE